MIYAKKKAGRRKKEKKEAKSNWIWNIEEGMEGKEEAISLKKFQTKLSSWHFWTCDLETTIIKQNFEIILRGGFQNCFVV